MLSAWQWILLAAVPPAIIALYFLKLKRLPLEVPSTYLWHKSIEDLHVNSIWQRLRQSLLLFLQLLLIALAILALLRPTWNDTRLPGDRFIFLIDNSASMGAKDMDPTRLEAAKKQALADIDNMESGDVGMVISFSDTARVDQQFTGSQKLLRQAVESIKQTNRTTNMKEALQVAAGLANPGRSATDVSDVQVAEAMPATLLIYSDGGLDRVQDFSLGNLQPEYRQMGVASFDQPDPKQPDKKRGQILSWAPNVGIATFSTRRKEAKQDQLEAFARLENYGQDDVEVEVELRLDGELVDARRVEIAAEDSNGVPFDLGEIRTGVLELRAKTGDMLAIDDTAWAVINPPKRAKVLFVSPGNDFLSYALDSAFQLADVSFETPAYLNTPKYEAEASSSYGLIIYDRCQPKEMPAANTLFIGMLPPDKQWEAQEKVAVPQIITTESSHPLMNLVEMGDVLIVEATPLKPPQGAGRGLIESTAGPIFAIAPRGAYEDAVLGFEIEGSEDAATNWPLRLSFPIFVKNVLEYLGGSRTAEIHARPGTPVALQIDIPTESITIVTPDKRSVRVPRGNLGSFNFAETERPGVYEVRYKDDVVQRFPVNLFYPPESDIKPKDLVIGHTEVEGQSVREPTRREAWKLLLLVGLGVLLFEWYIYNRRVYL
jgi:hypothetical protein